jgi:hypothetical protein
MSEFKLNNVVIHIHTIPRVFGHRGYIRGISYQTFYFRQQK